MTHSRLVERLARSDEDLTVTSLYALPITLIVVMSTARKVPYPYLVHMRCRLDVPLVTFWCLDGDLSSTTQALPVG